jgi:hypothetical protein
LVWILFLHMSHLSTVNETPSNGAIDDPEFYRRSEGENHSGS